MYFEASAELGLLNPFSKKSQQLAKTQHKYQSPKVVLPRLSNKKSDSLPSYAKLKTERQFSSHKQPNNRTLGTRLKGYSENTTTTTNSAPQQPLSIYHSNHTAELIRVAAIGPPRVSAKSWIIYDSDSNQTVKSLNPKTRRQIASLTKMMTALVSIQLCTKFSLDLKETYFRVTDTAIQVSGTVANLQSYEWINVLDLLYGLMLPSGNDAANETLKPSNVTTAHPNSNYDPTAYQELWIEIRSIDLTEDEENVDDYISEFVEVMNNTARRIGMKSTRFTNPHGLDYKNNYSCCEDLITLNLFCNQNSLFREIVSTKDYRGESRIYRNNKMYRKKIMWTNTNKLLGILGCCGGKTGYTPKAGGCLTTIYRHSSQLQASEIIVIVLGAKSHEHRFLDTQQLIEWFYSFSRKQC